MADLTELQSSQSVKILGANPSGLETNPVNSTTSGDLEVNDGIRSGGVYGNINLPTANTSVEVRVGATRLLGRKNITIVPVDADVYWGYNSSVTPSTGTPLFKNQMLTISTVDDTAQIWVVCANSNKNIRATESP